MAPGECTKQSRFLLKMSSTTRFARGLKNCHLVLDIEFPILKHSLEIYSRFYIVSLQIVRV